MAAACALVSACEQAPRPIEAQRQAIEGDPARGRQLLSHYQCSSCHVIPDVRGPAGVMGPPLAAFGQRSHIAGQLPNEPAVLRAWLLNPQALIPGTAMPDVGVSERDARDMAAYLLLLS